MIHDVPSHDEQIMFRTITSFAFELPEGNGGDRFVPGYAVALSIAEQLHGRGLRALDIKDYQGIAWSVECAVRGDAPWFYVGKLGLDQSPWQLFICSGVQGVRRFFSSDSVSQQALVEAIHQILRGDERVSDLGWFETLPSESRHSSPFG